MSSNFQLFIDFHDWVEDHLVVGTDGLGNDAPYVRIDALQEYWEDQIYPLLRSCSHDEPIHVPIEDINKGYLRIFSVLAYISSTQVARLNYIKKFMEKGIDDDLLPFEDKPDAFSNAPDAIRAFEDFQNQQYLFSPVDFGRRRFHNEELLARSVLPLNVEEVLSGKKGETSIVKKCKVHPSSGLKASSIVLKEFDSSEKEYSFKNESNSYINLENKIPSDVYAECFLTYYGSFRKGDKAFIMLEYTDHGSLLDFFSRNELPLERHELRDLWLSLSDLFIGLELIHGLEHEHQGSIQGTIRGVHQDLKPANIFVFSRSDSTPYHFRFKIGDFGMSSLALVKTRNKLIRGHGNPSTKMYGAPELTLHYPALDGVGYGARWDVDVWSMGCVLFEVLVWTTCGTRGISEFFEMRQRATDRVLNHTSQGYSGCFHNGTSRIQAVDDMMTLIIKRRRIFDDLSEPIGTLILKEMLIPNEKCRLEARYLLPRFQDILKPQEAETGRRGTISEQYETPDAQSGGRSRGSTAERDGSYKDFQRHQQARKSPNSLETHEDDCQNQEFTDTRVLSPPDERSYSRRRAYESWSSYEVHPTHEMRNGPRLVSPPPERGHGYARVTISQVIRWIDDKKNRRAPRPLPDHDRAMREIDNREQIFVVDDSDTMRTHHWDKVIEAVLALGYLVKPADPDGMELFLTSDPAKCKKSRDSNGLVRTLEDHQRTSFVGACNMENSLSPIFDHVKNGLKNRTTVALQFIQFGNDALGKERLRYLDDTLGEQLDFDIVDHRHCEDGVWHMLVGPISRGLDKDNNVGTN
ncbi:hypothetical protein J7T55_002596 [Diaporthe amygdali]|uniref:uncharacterized protein n=1 Tax=Phomopsis amygdali TaxID=1214568 RepID=UPI0022FF0E9C|nr:uncharacterized protein J7T55_002596 [Diaporthe amygdali]KAJ0122084.1 hypothetical protein J7T55_002596 [Diaporthe amygdali]